MREKILEYLTNHPGARKREIASFLKVWQCSFEFLATIDDMCEDNLIRAESFSDPANMEYYDKWYVVK